MLIQYKGFKDFLKDIPKFTNIAPNIDNYKTVIDLLATIKKIPIDLLETIKKSPIEKDAFNKGVKFFERFCVPFISLQTTFKWAKHKIGIISQNKVIELLQDQVNPHNLTVFKQESVSLNAPNSSHCTLNSLKFE